MAGSCSTTLRVYLLRGLAVVGVLDLPTDATDLIAFLQSVINQGLAESDSQIGTFYDSDVADQVSGYEQDLALGYRVIVVAHSQGTLYANASRAALAEEDPANLGSFGIVAIGDAAEISYNGYVTSDHDLVINALRTLGKTVLPANVDVPVNTSDFTGHLFEATYVNAQLPARASVVALLSAVAARLPYPPGLSGACGTSSDGGTDAGTDGGGQPPAVLIGGLWGDPHFYTWDGYHYNLQRVGEFVLVQDASGQPLIQARFHPYGTSKTVATIASVAANVDGDVVEVDANGAAGPLTWVNGVTGSGGLPHGGHLTPGSITWKDGVILQIVDHGDRLDLEFRPYAGSSLTGLLGNGDGDFTDDLTLRDGTTLSLPLSSDDEDALVSSWRITQTESLFYYPPGADTTTYTDHAFPYGPARAGDHPAATYASAESTCATAGIQQGALMDACILDVGTTGDPSFATAMVGIPAPVAAPPAIYQFSTNPASLTVDDVSSAAAPISPDGRKDGVFDVSVQGPVAAFVVATTNSSGTAAGGHYWETLVGQTIPAGVSGLSGGSTTWVVGVTERGSSTFLNNTNGSLPLLDGSVHDLTLYISSDGSIQTGALLRAWAIGPNGSVSPSPILTY